MNQIALAINASIKKLELTVVGWIPARCKYLFGHGIRMVLVPGLGVCDQSLYSATFKKEK